MPFLRFIPYIVLPMHLVFVLKRVDIAEIERHFKLKEVSGNSGGWERKISECDA